MPGRGEIGLGDTSDGDAKPGWPFLPVTACQCLFWFADNWQGPSLQLGSPCEMQQLFHCKLCTNGSNEQAKPSISSFQTRATLFPMPLESAVTRKAECGRSCCTSLLARLRMAARGRTREMQPRARGCVVVSSQQRHHSSCGAAKVQTS